MNLKAKMSILTTESLPKPIFNQTLSTYEQKLVKDAKIIIKKQASEGIRSAGILRFETKDVERGNIKSIYDLKGIAAKVRDYFLSEGFQLTLDRIDHNSSYYIARDEPVYWHLTARW